MNGEALVQTLIHSAKIGAISAIAAFVAWTQTEAARDAIGEWYIWLPVLTTFLAGVVRALGGATYQPASGDVRGADAGARGKRPNIFAI